MHLKVGCRRICWVSITLALIFPVASISFAGGKVGVYGIRMVPYGIDADQYSGPGWGLGFHGVVPVPEASNVIAGTVGLDWVNLLNHTESFIDDRTQLRIEQQTDQNFYRLYLGAQIGGHGNGFFRPHLGANLALVYYEISTDVVVPDDYNREQEIRQKLRGEGNFAFGYDLSMGLDMNFSNKIALDFAMKNIKSFSVPEQLGEGSVRIHPQYVQFILGIGVSFDMLDKREGDNED